jgi:hypothetical protein
MRVFGFVSLLALLGVGYVVMQRSAGSGSDPASPQERIDVLSIRQQLLTIGQAERQYLATHGTYASLEQLEQDDLLPGGTETRGYVFSAVVAGANGFTITATPVDPEKSDWPVLVIDESLQVAER